MPERNTFRSTLNTLRKASGHSQVELAQALGLHPQVLSRKLTGNDNAYLTQAEIKCAIQTLVTWDAITTRQQADNLLALHDLPPTFFSPAEWNAPPLNQLVADVPRPPRTPPLPSTRQTRTLPTPMTALIGREGTVERVRALLAQPHTRLITLTGPGGVGKTRLALHIATILAPSFADGVVYVELAALTDPALVPATIAQTLGVRETAQADIRQSMADALRERQTLLVLDNFEHVTEAAEVVAFLLAAAPGLRVLVTSRSILRLYGERQYAVSPLDVPSVEDAAAPQVWQDYAAVRLFVERAQAVQPTFTLTAATGPVVAAICAHLDGVPLAIELAAARVNVLSPQVILARLENRLSALTTGPRGHAVRHQTLRQTIDWSYVLLTDAEKRLFGHLAVFRGSFTLDAAQAVCGDSAEDDAVVVSGVESLVDKSMLYRVVEPDTAPHFRMLEMIRDFAQERHAVSPDAAQIEQRHSAYYSALLTEAEPSLHGPHQMAWLERLDRERDNVRAFLTRAIAQNDAATIVRVCGAWSRYCWMRGFVSEWRQTLESCLHQTNTTERAHILTFLVPLLWAAGDFVPARAWAEESVALWRTLDEPHGLSNALVASGLAYMSQEYAVVAGDYLREGVALLRTVGRTWELAEALDLLGCARKNADDYPAALAALSESVALYRTIGDVRGIAITLNDLSYTALNAGHTQNVRAWLEESVHLLREIGDLRQLAWTLNSLGEFARSQDDYTLADQSYTESLTFFRKLGAPVGVSQVLHNVGQVALFNRDYAAAEAHFGESLALRQNVQRRLYKAESLAGLAATAAALGQDERAAHLCGTLDAFFAQSGSHLDTVDQRVYTTMHAAVRARLAPEEWDRAWQTGQALSIDAATTATLPEHRPPLLVQRPDISA